MLTFLLVTTAGARAQLSPGKLSQAHASLEGVTDCTKCHSNDRELAPEKCLSCHIRIKNEQEESKGLHGQKDYQECQKCHVEHLGRDVSLIYWKGGEKAFDHNLTGFMLEGKHASLNCRDCHLAKFMRGLSVGSDERIDPGRTFMGLHSECTSCHVDEHRGQEGDNCLKCHNQVAWKPVVGFDHARTEFALTGKHQTVDCVKCHVLQTDRPIGKDPDYMKLTGLKFERCTDCHKDAHNGRLGQNCTSCHNTSGWFKVNTTSFDHSKTRYPLEGMHVTVTCSKCHGESQSKKGLKFAACTDCHTDYHRGQFAKRASRGACEECHTVKGFTPANFLMSQHDKTDYPLRGAHRAVPCVACHKKSSLSGPAAYNFVFKSTTCFACHKDPHHGQVDSLVTAFGCESCHSVNDWAEISYDHSRTKFPLEGKHAQTTCFKCHGDTAAAKINRSDLRFVNVRTDCQSCHADVHRNQFAAGNATDCSRCHTPADWKASKFNHQTARYKLDGAHQYVACNKCHPTVSDDAGKFVRYKPLDTSCVSCHGTTLPERRG